MRRGQAALEYLVTYGWGFIVILVVIGAMAYFGVLSPSKYLPQRCDFGAQLQCVDYMLWEPSGSFWQTGRMRLVLQNNFGDDIEIMQFYINGVEVDTFHANTPSHLLPYAGDSRGGPVLLTKGNTSLEFRLRLREDTGFTFVDGERMQVPLTIEFARAVPGSPLHNVTGEIYATVRQ